MRRDFPVAVPPGNPRLLLVLVTGIPILTVIGLLIFGVRNRPLPIMVPVMVAGVFVLMFFVLGRAMQRRSITLDDGVLDILATFFRHRVPLQDIDLEKSRVVDLAEHGEWRPFVKTNGYSLPGISAGWYRSRDLTSLFCLVTNRQRVLVLPLRAGGAVLLSAERPTELLNALRSSGK
jgi:Bacterial PH domain